MKYDILKIIGYIVLFIGIILMLLGIAISTGSEPDDLETGIAMAIFSSSFAIIGIIMLLRTKKHKREQELIDLVVSTVKSYRKITINDLSEKTDLPLTQCRELLAKAMSKMQLKGSFDRSTDEFFTKDYIEQMLEYKVCPSCGKSFDRIYLKGEIVKCDSCGNILNS